MKTDLLHFKRGGPGARPLLTAAFAAIALFVLTPVHAVAVDLAASSNTYVQSREDADGAKLTPLFEYLDFSVQDLGSKTISAHFGGWFRYELKEQTTNKDVQYGYLRYKGNTADSTIDLGRVMVFGGVAAERVDGIHARTGLVGNLDVSAFGGTPVETGPDLPGNDVIYGGRLSHQVPGLYMIGISALKEEKNSEDFRKEEGVDLWLRPINKVEVSGRSAFNAITKDWMDHTYFLGLGPFADLRLNTTASWIDYGSYFSGATAVVFFFQPTGLDAKERAQILGEEIAYKLTNNLEIAADYKAFSYEIAGDAKYYGGNLRFSVPGSGGAGLAVHRMDGDTDLLKYKEYRAYCFVKFGKADVTLDAFDVTYDVARNDVTDAYSLTLAASYEVLEKLKVGADVEYSKNPDFDSDTRGFFKIVYSFDTAAGLDEMASARKEVSP